MGPEHHRVVRVAASAAEAAEAAGRVLRRRHWRVVRGEGGLALAAEKGLLREAGSLVFHWAFVLLLIGVVIGKGTGYSGLPTGSCVVLIELGGNDILSKATAESFAADMRRLLSSVTDPHRSVVMFELPLLPMQNRYGYVQRRVSAEFGVRLIPRRVLAAAVTWPGHTTDGLHLSPAGHRWLADTVAKWL